MSSQSRKRVKELLAQAEALGCIVTRTRGGHWKITTPSGALVFCGHSPGDNRALDNTRSHLRKNGVPL